MTKYLNFFESESGFTEAVEAGQLFFPNVSYTEEDDTVHWNLEQPADPVETPMLRMHFITSTPGQEVKLGYCFTELVTAIEIDGTPVNYTSGGTYSVAEPGNHTAVYQFASPAIPERLFWAGSGALDTFTSAEIISPVTSIVSNAFHRCSALSSVTIPDSVRTIGFQTFYGCTSLQSVALPDGLTDIDLGAFANCSSLYDINIPSGVTRIGEHAFLNCSGLTAIYLNPETPPSLGADALLDTNDCPIYVPAASVETYKQAWPGYASRIKTKYNISASVNDSSLGEVNVLKNAPEGAHVDFHVDVFEMDRYQVSSVSITDGNGDEVEYEGDEYDYYFEMPASDVTISVVIGEKPKHTVTVNSTDDLVNPDDIHFNSDDGEPSFGEGSMADFSFNLPEGLQLVSVQASDCDGNSIEVELEDGGDGFHFCYFTMPHCDVSVFITVEVDTRPRYNISWSVNDDSLGVVAVQETALEGETFSFDVKVFDPDANHVSSVTCTDGNGNEIKCWWDFDEGDHSRYHINDMPASDITIEATIEEKPKYHISVDLNDEELGKVNLEKETASEGDQVNFNVRIFDSGQNQVSSVTVTDGNGDEVEYTVKDYGGGVLHLYTFKMPASDVTISVVIEPKQ